MTNRFELANASEYPRGGNYYVTTRDAGGVNRCLFGPFPAYSNAREFLADGSIAKLVESIPGLEDSARRIRIEPAEIGRSAELNSEVGLDKRRLISELDAHNAPDGEFRLEYSAPGSRTFIVGSMKALAYCLASQKDFYAICTPIEREGGFAWLSEKKDAIVELRGVDNETARAFNRELKESCELAPDRPKAKELRDSSPPSPGR